MDTDDLCDKHNARVTLSMVLEGHNVLVNGYGPYQIVHSVGVSSRHPAFYCLHSDIKDPQQYDYPPADEYAFPTNGEEPSVEPRRLRILFSTPSDANLEDGVIPPIRITAVDERAESVGEMRVVTDAEIV